MPTHRSLLSGVVAAAALALGPSGASAATVTTFPLPTPDEGVADITVGPDGNLWYASEDAYKVGRITTGGAISEWNAPWNTNSQDDTGPDEIVTGDDGAMYALTDVGETVLRITPDGGAQDIFYNLIYNARHISPRRGGGVWQTLAAGSGDSGNRIVAPNGSVAYFDTGLAGGFAPIATAPDGSAWYADGGNAIRRLTEAGEQRNVAIPPAMSPEEVSSIAVAPDGTPWFTAYFQIRLYRYSSGGTIGRVNPDGRATLIDLGGDYLPYEMTPGPDGALWWIERNGIGRLDPGTGAIQHASLGALQPGSLAFGPDGGLWFTERNVNAIGRIALDGALFAAGGATTAPAPVAPAPPAAPARRAPAVRLTLKAQRLATVRRRNALKASCRLDAAGTCVVRATITAKVARRLGLKPKKGATTQTLATGRATLAKAGTATVSLKLGTKARSALRRARSSLAVRFIATSQAAGATPVTTSRSLTLRR